MSSYAQAPIADRESKRLRCLEIDDQFSLVGCKTGSLAGFAPLRILPREGLIWTPPGEQVIFVEVRRNRSQSYIRPVDAGG
jgi:hypothetical protein